MARKRTFIVENTWNCSSCRHKNKGRHMKCQSCGSPKEKHEKYDTSKNLTSPEVKDSELLRQARAGKNWECSYCGGSVRNYVGECKTCGGPKTRATKGGTPLKTKGADGKEFVFGYVTPNKQSEEPLKPGEVRPGVRLEDTMPELAIPPEPERVFEPQTGNFREAPKSHIKKPKVGHEDRGGNGGDDGGFEGKLRGFNWQPFLIGALVFALVGSIVGVCVWAFMPHEEHVVVDDVHWVYTAHLQQRQLNHGTDWDGNMPAGAFNVSCVTRQHGTEDCNPHDCMCHTVTDYCSEECNCVTIPETCSTSCTDLGNGYSSCTESCSGGGTSCSTCQVACGSHEECSTCYDQCPVYDEWCDFDYYTWPTIDTERTQGHGHNMHEPDLEVQPDPPAPQRIVREHDFSVIFENEEGENWEFEPENVTDFNRFDTGDTWLIEVNRLGSVYPQHEEAQDAQ